MPLEVSNFKAASISAGLFAAITSAISFTKSWNISFLETKSVSEFTSTIAAVLPLIATDAKPSAAIRSFFFAAFAIPFSRNKSTAFSMSPSTSTNARFASIIPTPVISRNSFTNLAVTSAIFCFLLNVFKQDCLSLKKAVSKESEAWRLAFETAPSFIIQLMRCRLRQHQRFLRLKLRFLLIQQQNLLLLLGLRLGYLR